MPVDDGPRVHEVRVHGCASTEETLALQDPISRVVCPDPEHAGPCEAPWGVTIDDGSPGDGAADVLVMGIYATSETAEDVAARVRAVVGATRPVELGEGDPERFAELVEQYRIENAPGA